MERRKPIAIALDLGSTRIKAGCLYNDGRLVSTCAVNTPTFYKAGLLCEGDANAYLEMAEDCLVKVQNGLPPGIPVGIASQRSTFLLWKRTNGMPVTPMISWQDRRADTWCQQNAQRFPTLQKMTGLRLSPHYAAPKLAHLFEHHTDLATAAHSGELAFGTPESYLIWRLTQGTCHQTDLSMAARTLLADPRCGQWSPVLCTAFGIPLSILPQIVPTYGRNINLSTTGILSASMADQAAAVAGVSGFSNDSVVVNLGTGAFVLLPTGKKMKILERYLSGPLFKGPDGEKMYALEGTVNGIGKALAETSSEKVSLTISDSHPHGMCLPDTAGIGAPFWQAQIPFSLSRAARKQSGANRRRIIMEGIIFRITGIIKTLRRERKIGRILLSGGLSSEPFLAKGLSVCSGLPVYQVVQKELTLIGAAQLAAGNRQGRCTLVPVEVKTNVGVYLSEKYDHWLKWVHKILSTHGENSD